MHSIRSKQTSIEIEQLNARVIEAETRLKTEVTRIKKKLQIQITELEMSLDVANKTNIDLQKVIKKQSLQLTELQAHYEDVQRQLQATLDQYAVAQRRLAGLNGELEEVRSHLDSANRAKRTVELQYEEAASRINELTTANVSLVSIKSSWSRSSPWSPPTTRRCPRSCASATSATRRSGGAQACRRAGA